MYLISVIASRESNRSKPYSLSYLIRSAFLIPDSFSSCVIMNGLVCKKKKVVFLDGRGEGERPFLEGAKCPLKGGE